MLFALLLVADLAYRFPPATVILLQVIVEPGAFILKIAPVLTVMSPAKMYEIEVPLACKKQLALTVTFRQ